MSASPFNTLFQSVFRLQSPIRLLRSFCLWLLICIVCAAVASPLYAATPLDTPVVTAIPGRAQATLTWNAVDGATIYSVYQSTVAGEIGSNISNPQVASLSRNGLEIGKRYYFSVQARNSKQTSAISTQVSVVPIDAPVLATPSFQDGVVALSWTKITGANYYEVFRAPSSGIFGTTALGTTTENTFADNTAVGGTTYNYKIRVANPTPNTNLVSNIANVTLMAKPVVTVIPATSRVSLSWNTIGGRSGYSVYQSGTAGQRGNLLKTIQNTNLEITGLTNGANYYYTVVAFNAAGNSTVSDQVKVVPVLGPTLSVTGLGVNSVSLSWTAIEGASYYQIFRAPNNWNFGTTPLATTSGRIFTDTTASNGTSYFYRIRVANPTPNAYLISNVANAVPLAKPVLTAQPASGKVSLTWNDVTGRGGYRIYQSETSGDRGTLIKTTLATNLVVSGLNNGSTYYFTVQVFNTTGDGPASDAVSAIPVAAPTLSVTGVGNGKVSLAWTTVQGASFYEVYRGPNNWNFGATPIATTTSTTFDDSSIASGTSYFYKVRVGNPVSNPNLESNIVNATPLASPVLTAVVASSKVTLNWNAIVGRSGYNVYQSEVAGQIGTLVKTTLGTTQAITGLESGRLYFFTVVVGNAAGQSVPSNQVKVIPGPIPDRGGRIAYCARIEGNMDIYIMNADGSNKTRLTTNPDYDMSPVFSADGSKIIFVSIRNLSAGIYSMNADGTDQTLIVASPTVSRFRLSPDGSKIIFASSGSSNSHILVMNLDGTNKIQLTNGATTDSEPSFSPDGSKILYTAYTNSVGTAIIMNADGTNPIEVPNTIGSREAAFSPDGTKITFTQYNESGFLTTRIVNLDGTGKAELTTGQFYDFTPVFSPNGNKIAISSAHEENRDIYVVNADGTNLTQLTTRNGFDPVWAPGFVPATGITLPPDPLLSGKIAFTSTRDGNTDIYVVNADGTDETRLTTTVAEDSHPSFSPDGSKIVFQSTRSSDGNSEIYTMNWDGTNPTRLTNSSATDSQPVFSPDGSKIAFISNDDLYVMNADGTNPVRIAQYAWAPSFSPDSSKIIFMEYMSGNIGIINADGTNLKRITDSYYLFVQNPIFNFDGSRILALSFGSELISLNLEGKDRQSLGYVPFSFGNASFCLSPDGKRIVIPQFDDRLYVMFTDGTAKKRITTQTSREPSWGPVYVPNPPTPPSSLDRGKIVYTVSNYVEDYSSFNSNIFIMNADGTNKTQLTTGNAIDINPVFSPDGSKILFISSSDSDRGELYIMNSDGTNRIRLTNNRGFEGGYCFSPDGTKIAYDLTFASSRDICTINIDGTNDTRLTTAIGVDPRFSPDGSKIVFMSYRDNTQGEIYTMNSDGSNQVRLTDSDAQENNPVFSPDGTKIAFGVESADHQHANIGIMNADGTGFREITNDSLGYGVNKPLFSPDGNKIVFFRVVNIGYAIMSANLDGSDLTEVSRNARTYSQPVFSPDGNQLAFTAGYPREVYTVKNNGTRLNQLTSDSNDFRSSNNPDWAPGSVPPPSPSPVVSRAKAPSGSSAAAS